MLSVSKQIEAAMRRRGVVVQSMTALSDTAAGDGTDTNPARMFTTEEQATFDAGLGEVRTLDSQLVTLREAEQRMSAQAVPLAHPLAPAMPAATPGVAVRAYKPFKGQGFVRYVLAVARTKGNMHAAADLAAHYWKDQTPEVELLLRAIAQTGQMPSEVFRAAVAAGTTSNATWAGPLVYAQNLSSEFIDLLRPATILGRLPLRLIPFNVSIPRQTGGVTAQWVGEGLSKPVGALSFDRLSIPWAKVSIISVITDELARFSDPSAEMLVRDDLVLSIAAFIDRQFTDPTVAPSANLRPGAITNGTAQQVLVVPSTGVTIAAIYADTSNLFKQMAALNLPMTRMFWVMNPAALITLQNIRTTVDTLAFPETVADPPRFRGYPVITSTTIPLGTPAAGQTFMILLDANEIFHAEDPVVDVQASNEASLQMDSAPATPPTPLVSMFQQNMLAIRAEQYQYWLRRRDATVGMITAFQT